MDRDRTPIKILGRNATPTSNTWTRPPHDTANKARLNSRSGSVRAQPDRREPSCVDPFAGIVRRLIERLVSLAERTKLELSIEDAAMESHEASRYDPAWDGPEDDR